MRLDLGCGKHKKEGFIGVDCRAVEGVDVVCNLGVDVWPWGDETVDEIHSSHMIEHLTAPQRIHFVNEAYRVMRRGAKMQLVTPHWASCRAYGDLTHQWPPVSEMWFYYLSRGWREAQAPHNDGYSCDFVATWGYSLNPSLATRAQDFRDFAVGNYKEAAQDIIATLTKQ